MLTVRLDERCQSVAPCLLCPSRLEHVPGEEVWLDAFHAALEAASHAVHHQHTVVPGGLKLNRQQGSWGQRMT